MSTTEEKDQTSSTESTEEQVTELTPLEELRAKMLKEFKRQLSACNRLLRDETAAKHLQQLVQSQRKLQIAIQLLDAGKDKTLVKSYAEAMMEVTFAEETKLAENEVELTAKNRKLLNKLLVLLSALPGLCHEVLQLGEDVTDEEREMSNSEEYSVVEDLACDKTDQAMAMVTDVEFAEAMHWRLGGLRYMYAQALKREEKWDELIRMEGELKKGMTHLKKMRILRRSTGREDDASPDTDGMLEGLNLDQLVKDQDQKKQRIKKNKKGKKLSQQDQDYLDSNEQTHRLLAEGVYSSTHLLSIAFAAELGVTLFQVQREKRTRLVAENNDDVESMDEEAKGKLEAIDAKLLSFYTEARRLCNMYVYMIDEVIPGTGWDASKTKDLLAGLNDEWVELGNTVPQDVDEDQENQEEQEEQEDQEGNSSSSSSSSESQE